MQINIDGFQMYQELQYAYNICKEHIGCIGCQCTDGQPIQIGNSVIFCENFEKNKKDT